MHHQTKILPVSALFIALGIAFPFFFHMAGLGKIFLPMFWPLAAAGFFLPFSVCALVGILTPVLSFLMTAMPPPPILYLMIGELALLTTGVHWIHHKWGVGNFWAVLLSLALSQMLSLGLAWLIAPMLGLPPRFYAFARIFRSAPGLIAIVAIVPLFVSRLTKTSLFHAQVKHE